MQRLNGRQVDQTLAGRAVVVVFADVGDEDSLNAPGPHGDRVTKLVSDALEKLAAEASHVELRVAHRLRSSTALARWGLGGSPLSAAVVVDGVVVWHEEVPLNEAGATRTMRGLAGAVALWPADPDVDRAAEAAVRDAEGHVEAEAWTDAVAALFGPGPHTRLPTLRDETWRDRALSVAARALAGAKDGAAARMLLAWDEREPRPADEVETYIDAVSASRSRDAAAALLERWAERFPDLPGLAVGQARLQLAVGDAEGALATARRALDSGAPARESRRLALDALRRLGRFDEALTELANLRHVGGWNADDETAYAELREKAFPPGLRTGRGKARGLVADIEEGARRLGRGLMAFVRKEERGLPFRPELLADAPSLLRTAQVNLVLAELTAEPIVEGVSHPSLYWTWRADGAVLDAVLEGDPVEVEPSDGPAETEYEPLPKPGSQTRGTAKSAADATERLAAFAELFREFAMAEVLATTRVNAARTTRWALQARSAGIDAQLVTAFECAAREEAARAEAVDDWLKARLAGDASDRAHAGWHAAAEAAHVQVDGLDGKYAELRLALDGYLRFKD